METGAAPAAPGQARQCPRGTGGLRLRRRLEPHRREVLSLRGGISVREGRLVDHCLATVGTADFDNRTFRLNFDVTAVIAVPAFAARVERMFEADFAQSWVMAPGEYDRKPWWFRFGARLARLTGPVQ